MREHHDEDPGAATTAEIGIDELAGGAEIDLRFVAGLHFQTQRRAAARGELAKEALTEE